MVDLEFIFVLKNHKGQIFSERYSSTVSAESFSKAIQFGTTSACNYIEDYHNKSSIVSFTCVVVGQ